MIDFCESHVGHASKFCPVRFHQIPTCSSPDSVTSITLAGLLAHRPDTDWQVLQAALENPSAEVHELAMTHLREFAEAGDPFSQAILEGREIP
jgi:hypothetical protein